MMLPQCAAEPEPVASGINRCWFQQPANKGDTAMTSSTHAIGRASHSSPASSGPGHSLRRWWDAFWAHRAQRVSVRLLSSLDDRTLQDIGVNRSEIGSIVYAKSA